MVTLTACKKQTRFAHNTINLAPQDDDQNPSGKRKEVRLVPPDQSVIIWTDGVPFTITFAGEDKSPCVTDSSLIAVETNGGYTATCTLRPHSAGAKLKSFHYTIDATRSGNASNGSAALDPKLPDPQPTHCEGCVMDVYSDQ
jgi:hypothetical protein